MKKTVKKPRSKTPQAALLRSRAEELAREKAAPSPEDLMAMSPEEIRQTLHKLRVHQIELKMQNEELCQAQVDLDAERARYFDLYDLAPVGYLTVNEKGQILESNIFASILLGVSRGALNKKQFSQFILPEDQDIYYLHRKQLFETSEQQACELRLLKKDGTIFWILLEAGITKDINGALVCRVVLNDITERKLQEENLLRAMERLSFAQISAGAGIWDWDMGTGQLSWSKELFPLFGLDPSQAEASFDTWRKVIHPEDIQAAEAQINDAIRDNKQLYNEYRIIKPKGDVRWISAYGNTVYDKEGKPLRMTGVCIDITERKEADTQLQIKNKMLASINEYTQTIVLAKPDQLYKTIVNRLKEITESAEVFINDYDEGHSELVLNQSTLSEENNTWVRKKLGIRFTNFRSPVSKRQYDEIIGSTIGRVGSLNDVTFGAIPASVSSVIEKAFGFGWFVGLALNYNEKLVGTIMIAGKEGQTQPDNEELLAYANATATVLARRRAEIAMAESEKRFRELFNRMSSGVAVYEAVDNGGDFIFRDFNPAAERIEKISRKDIIGKRVTEAFPGVEAFGIFEVFKRVWQTGKPEYYPENVYEDEKTSGSWRENWVFKLPTGEIVAIYNDITDRKRAEEAMRESEEKYRELVRYAPSGIYELDYETNRFTSVNDIICEYTEYTRDELLSMNFFTLLTEDSQKLLSARIEKLKAGEETEPTVEFCVRKKNGNYMWGLFTVRHFYDAGKLKSATGIIHNITERKMAEERLRQANVFLDSIVENIPDMIFLKDAKDLKFVLLNRAGEDLLGHSRKDMLFKNDYDFFPKQQADHFTQKDRDVLSGKKLQDIPEESIQTINRGERILHTKKVPLLGVNGEPEFLLGISEDITERKQVEKALIESNLRYRLLSEHTTDTIWLMDMDLKMTYHSPSGEKLRGFTVDEIKEMPLEQQFTPESFKLVSELIFNNLPRIIADPGYNPILKLDLEYSCKDGSTVWAESKFSIIRDKSGNPVSIMGEGRNVTERKQAEEALKESERVKSELLEKLNEAQHVALIGSWEWNLLTDKVWWSDETYLIFGVTRQDYIPSFEENGRFIHPDDLAMYGSLFEHSLQTGEPLDYVFRLIAGDGLLKHCQAKGNVVKDSSGKPVRFIGTIMDITGRRHAEEEKARLEAQLHQAQKMESVGRLAGGVAHDYNNMLGVILGYAELALMKISPEQPLHANLEEINKAAERSVDLTRQLLAFARKQTIAPKVLDLNETVEGMLKMLRMLIGEDIDLVWLPGKRVWPVKVDPSQIDQILANLCVNARDAIAGVGRITIETNTTAFDKGYHSHHLDFEPGEYVQIVVSDNGCGMDKETLANVFEPFFTTKEVGKGTGLGLATVYGIVKQNKGFINVYSEPGKGTTFTIYLPRHEGVAQVQEEGVAEQALGGHEIILLVEDELAILNMASKMLQQLGYTVLAASSPGEAIRLAEEYASSEIHLLMTDVVMPEMNGSELVRKLLSLYPHLKSLFMSGYTPNVIAHHGVLDEGVQFIKKPFSIKEVAAKVREALDSK